MVILNIKDEINKYIEYIENVKKIGESNETKNVYLGDKDYSDQADHIDRILVWEAAHGDEWARELFILDKENYVEKIVNMDYEMTRFKKKGIEKEDLVQTGMIGVMDTIKKYDFRKDVKVRSYLASMIKFAIKNAYRKYGSLTVSREANTIYNLCVKKIDLMSENVSGDKIKELSKEIGLSEKKIAESIMAIRFGNSTLSYDNEGYIEADIKTNERIYNRTVMDYYESMKIKIDYMSVIEAMKKLEEDEKYVLCNIFFKDKTQKKTSEEMNISVATVGKIKRIAIAKIRMEVCEKGDDYKY